MKNVFQALVARPSFPVSPSWLALVGGSVLLAACGGGSDETSSRPDAPIGPQAVAIEFAAYAGQTPAVCDTPLATLGTTKVNAALRDLRFYVSNVALIDRAGQAVPLTLDKNEWQLQEASESLALVDLENATNACAAKGTAVSNSRITGTVPAGDYQGLIFTVGVPSRWNHTDYAATPAPLDLGALAWSWQSGRKYLQLEVAPEGGVQRLAPAAAGTTFHVHLGATGCTGNPVTGETVSCTRPNRAQVRFDAFNPATEKVVLDIAALLQKSDISQDWGSSVGCMSGASDPECAAVFAQLGLDLAAGTPLSGMDAQKTFVTRSK